MRTLLYTVLGLAVVTGGAYGASELRAREDAARRVDEARHVLDAPLARVAELDQIAAARAVDLLEQALELHDTPETRGLLALAEALARLQQGKLDRAGQQLAQARKLLPAQADLEVLAAALALRAGDRASAQQRVTAALALDPGHARARVLASDLSADGGEQERALALVEALILDFPAVGTLYNRRGLLHEALGESAAARADFERAAGLDPRLSQPHLNLGRLLRAQGRAREAENAFGEAVQRAPDDAEAWLGRGLTRIAQGDTAGGRLDLEQARALAPAEPAPLVALADLDAHDNQGEQAIARYRAALVLAPSDAVAWLKLGNTLTRAGQYPDARAAFEHAIALQPDLAAAHNGLGAALMGSGEHEAAARAFATAAALDTHDPNPLRNLALLHTRHGDARAAKQANDQALARAIVN